MTTDTRGLTSPVITDTGDLVVRLGRLAFADPLWTPAASRSAPVRGIADLAPDSGQAAVVVGAIHHAADALACVAVADLRAVGAAIRAWRVHVPTRTLPEFLDVPYRYWRVRPDGEAALIGGYQAAVAASERLALDLDVVAVTMGAPSRIRAAARVAARNARDDARDTADGRATGPAGDPGLAVEAMPGPVEQAVRSAGGADLVVLMRARAMDTAARTLIAEAKDDAKQHAQPDPEPSVGTPTMPVSSAARIAAASYPRGPAPRNGIRPATSETRAARTSRVPRSPEAGVRRTHG